MTPPFHPMTSPPSSGLPEGMGGVAQNGSLPLVMGRPVAVSPPSVIEKESHDDLQEAAEIGRAGEMAVLPVTAPRVLTSGRQDLSAPERDWGLSTSDRSFLAIASSFALLLLLLGQWREGSRHSVEVIPGKPVTLMAAPRLLQGETSTPLIVASGAGPVLQININTAPWTAFDQLDGLGERLSKRIVEDREQNGPFRSLQDLKRVKGIGDKIFARLEPHLTLSSPLSSASPSPIEMP